MGRPMLFQDAEERARRYIEALSGVLNRLESSGALSNPSIEPVIDNVKAYLSDARYYLERGDVASSLVAVAYAEGLLDALGMMGLLPKVERTQNTEQSKVFIAGTFDILHPGHVELIKYAASFGRLFVVVARDVNVVKDKGREPVLDENSRLKMVSAIRYVYRAMLGDEKDYLKPIEEVKPDVIVLGPDQNVNEEELVEEIYRRIGKRPKVVRFASKLEFSDGLRGSRDIIAKVCVRCRSLGT